MRRILGLAALVGGVSLASVWGQASGPATIPFVKVSGPAMSLTPAVKVSVVGDAYKVEGNIAYDRYPETVLDVISPKGERAAGAVEKRPGVIMFHGAGWVKSDKASMAAYYNLYLARGFVVCNVEYREPVKGGKASIETALFDSLKASWWFLLHADEYNVDKEKIVVTGTSGGGYLALELGMGEKIHDGVDSKGFKFAAVVNYYGATDLSALVKSENIWAGLWLPDGRGDLPEFAKLLSPINNSTRKDVPPVLTIQGDRDQVIPLAQGEALTKALKDAGADASMVVIKSAYHGFVMERMPTVAFETFDGFLAKHGIIKASGATRPAAYRGVPPFN